MRFSTCCAGSFRDPERGRALGARGEPKSAEVSPRSRRDAVRPHRARRGDTAAARQMPPNALSRGEKLKKYLESLHRPVGGHVVQPVPRQLAVGERGPPPLPRRRSRGGLWGGRDPRAFGVGLIDARRGPRQRGSRLLERRTGCAGPGGRMGAALRQTHHREARQPRRPGWPGVLAMCCRRVLGVSIRVNEQETRGARE